MFSMKFSIWNLEPSSTDRKRSDISSGYQPGFLFFMAVSYILLFLAMGMTGCISDDAPEIIERVKTGDRLPQFEVMTNRGDYIATEDLRRKRGMIVLFNTSCNDCRKELPIVQEVYDSFGDTASILCISRSETTESVAAYWKYSGLTLLYSAQSGREVYDLFASSVIPRVYVYDSSLTVTAIYTDNPVADFATLAQALERAGAN